MAIEPPPQDVILLEQLFSSMQIKEMRPCDGGCCRFYLAQHPNGAHFLLIVGDPKSEGGNDGRSEGHNLLVEPGDSPEQAFEERIRSCWTAHFCHICQRRPASTGDTDGQVGTAVSEPQLHAVESALAAQPAPPAANLALPGAS